MVKINHILRNLLLIVPWLLAVSCQRTVGIKPQTGKADSIIFAAGRDMDYMRLLALTDSFEQTGDISAMNANRWRGVGYSHLGQVRQAEFYYRKVADAKIEHERDRYYYIKSARRLAELLVRRGEYEEALLIAVPAVERLETWGDYSQKDMAMLTYTIGCCQLNLGKDKEAAANYDLAYHFYVSQASADSTVHNVNDAIIGTDNIATDYIHARHFAEAQMWADRADSLMNLRYAMAPDYRVELIDEYKARIMLHRALALQGLGETVDAAAAYWHVASSKYGHTAAGKIEAAGYLIDAGRYGEAADNYSFLDQMASERGLAYSLDNIRVYLLPKYRANFGAGRRDSALVLGLQLCDALDTAIVRAKSNDAAELATIYDTHQKEAQIAQQQADLSRQRLIGVLVASLLIVLFFVVNIRHRIKAQQRLAAAYEQLEVANEQLEQKNEQLTVANARAEESSRMKTDFIQQISHEIRTPLNILSGYTQLITTPNMELDEETQGDINKQILENTDRITGLVNKMLELSEVNSSTVIERNDQVPAVQIAAQAAEDSGITTAKHLHFDLQLDEGADSAMMQTNLKAATRALTLLLDNARKFTKPAEAYKKEVEEEQTVVLRLSASSGQVRFIVEDTGVGVPAEDAERIFDEFVQLNEYYDGTGIGLTVARSLARRLGGDIVLDTSYRQGARFVMTLS